MRHCYLPNGLINVEDSLNQVGSSVRMALCWGIRDVNRHDSGFLSARESY